MSGQAVVAAIRRGVGTSGRRWLFAATILLGVASAALLAATTTAPNDVFATITRPTESLMSVTMAFIGVLIVDDVRQGRARLGPTLVGAIVLAAVVGLAGDLISAVATMLGSDTANPWEAALAVAGGGVLVQITAQLTGTGLGLLLRPAVLACLATIVLPLGLWWALSVVPDVQNWLTPFAVVQRLLSAEVTPVSWAQWLVVLLLWGVGLNAWGAVRLQRVRSAVDTPA